MAVFRMSASTTVCIVYVYNTYLGRIPSTQHAVLKLLGIFLIIQFILKMILSPFPIDFVKRGESVMEALSLSSLVMAKQGDWLNFSFLQAYIVLSRYFQIEPTLELVFMQKTSPFHRQLARLVFEFIVFIYAFASGLQLFERMGDPWQALTATTFELTLANSFYFTVATIFTVGYGDFVPYTLMGRLWIIFIIFFGAYLVSRKIGQVIDVVSDLRVGRGSFVKGEGVDHCVLCGNVKWEYLKSFAMEFYGDSRNNAKKLVVICDKPNWSEEAWNKFFSANAQFRDNVCYLEGSCVSRDDLVRAQVDDAKAVFVLNNQHNPDAYAEDSETLKRILTIRSYMPNIPIYSMCALRDSMLQITYALEHLSEIQAEETMSRRGSMSTGLNMKMVSQDGRKNTAEMLRDGGFGEDGVNPASAYYSGDFSEDDDDGLLVPSYDGSSDLKSEAICMQEVEMSLLAENVFCNGLSTLLANLILRVIPQTKPTDQPWAIEYKIGSECRLEYVKLPLHLHDRKFSEIAMIMYDYGVVLIATKRFMDKKWRAVTPDTIIHLSTIGLIITFHSAHFLEKIMLHIAARVREMDSDKSTGSQDVPSPDDEFSERPVPRHNLAGDFLTGDVGFAYEYEADSDNGMFTTPIPVQDSGKSWPHESTTLDKAAQFQTPGRDAGSDPRSLPERSIPIGPLASMPERDPSNRLILTSCGTSVPEDAGDFPDAIVSSSASTQEANINSATPARVQPLDLDLVQDIDDRSVNSFSGNDSDDEMSSGEQNSFQILDAIEVSSHGGSGENSEGSQTAHMESNISHRVGASMIRQTPGDNGNDSEDAPPSVLRASSFMKGSISRRKGGLGKTHRVTFPNQKPGSLAAKAASGAGASGSKRGGDVGRRDQPLLYFGDDDLPVKVKGHIVVCTIGNMAMMNLRQFLRRVWVSRDSSTKDTPVVAICSHISEEDEAELATFGSDRLFLIQGNSLSVRTLKRAQFDQAKAIVILACEDKNDVDGMDAQAIFTVMTLDYLLGERSEVFVCTMLDAEESMQLLRAPAHARRRGADLGMEHDYSLEFEVSGMGRNSRQNMPHIPSSTSYRFLQGRLPELDSKRSFGNRTFSFGALSGAGDLPRSMSFVGLRSSTYTDRKVAIERHLGISDTNAVTREMSSNSYGRFHHPLNTENDDMVNNTSVGGTSALNFLMNPSNLTMGGGGAYMGDGTGHVRGLGGSMNIGARDECFERQRYASGEMMISSTYMALLIREYAMPGLMAVVRKIFGAGMGKNAKPKRCWIRTIHIPQKWILAGRDGQRTYREVFEVLLRHGAVALGLYRAGDVMVRVQLEVDPEFEGDRNEARSKFMDSGGLEMGGDQVSGLRASDSFERTGILENLPTYGSVGRSGDEVLLMGEEDSGSMNVPIPAGMLFDIAEDLHTAQQGDTPVIEDEGFHHYTCPSSSRTAYYKEVNGGDNVLPYVYTNPEAYTLVSGRDAVYVLVSPQVSIPNEW